MDPEGTGASTPRAGAETVSAAAQSFADKKTREMQRKERDKAIERVRKTADLASIYLTEEDKAKARDIVASAGKVKGTKLPFILAYAAAESIGPAEPKNAAKLASAAESLLRKMGFAEALQMREPLAGSTAEQVMASFEACLRLMKENGADIDVDGFVKDTREQLQAQVPQMPEAPVPPVIPTAETLAQYQMDVASFTKKLDQYVSASQAGMTVASIKASVTDVACGYLIHAAASVMAAAEPDDMMIELTRFLSVFHNHYSLILEAPAPPPQSPRHAIVEKSVRELYGS